MVNSNNGGTKMDVPHGKLYEEAIVDNRLHDLRTMLSLAEEERDVVKLLKQLHERNTIAFPFDLSDSEPILTQGDSLNYCINNIGRA